MTKTQIWVAALVALFLFLFIIQNFTGLSDEPVHADEVAMQSAPQPAPSPETYQASIPGDMKELLVEMKCITCHGQNLEGTTMGPSLDNMKDYYDKEKLIAYMKAPTDFTQEARMKILLEEYGHTIMPSYKNHDKEKLEKIAEFLLSK